MNWLTGTALAASCLIGTSAAGADLAARTAAAVQAADLAFEHRAEEVGPAQAFREYMDETDGLQFGNGPPTRGAAAIYKAMGGDAGPRSVLEWTPLQAWGSKGGDLGVTTGTWLAARNKDHSGPVVRGRYVTVWRRNAGGQWKGLIDIGNPDPK
ncbi:MAG TPA: nuclear transport factor 2 family protein [Caulobacteraceae bacterium]|jgi:ketosteroid isomerase-like protein